MKSTTKTEPWAKAQPYIMGAGDNLQGAYAANAPGIQQATNAVTSTLPSMVERYQQGDAGVNAARGYNVDVLGGRYLDQGNPELEGLISRTGDDVRNQVQAAMGARGQSGGSDYVKMIADRIARASGDIRYNDYNQERSRMATAAGQSPGIAQADYLSVMPMLATLDAASTPIDVAGNYAGGIGGLFGQYNKTTQKQGALGTLMQMAGQGLQAYGMGGFG